ncbi:transcriptional regulator [Streptomyces camponoticapitis]|uniref:Transcriptional regulator n=1 Tax=Streptomyces camponoticapitis TaxID=1616125 RepID=A0ABQ2DZF2_9ACTN|nr:IclR family transcriptional regulator C-terminal domain-containing protein [Streptomyces camponoticapitis]GGJ79781.1 transcriptional regulator [Streptomyces camponoticapitis]
MPRTPTAAEAVQPPAEPAVEPGGESVATLERGLAVVGALSADRGGRMRPSDLARATGLARSTVDRIVSTLVRLGYLRAEGRDVLLAPRLLELGNAYLAASRVPDAVDRCALRLADALDESVSVCVPDGDGARFVTQFARRRTMVVSFRVGDLLPAERCAPGALFAADWNEARWTGWRQRLGERPNQAAFPALPPSRGPAVGTADFERRVAAARDAGHALDDQLIEPGLIALAVPVYDLDGTVLCAVSVVSHTSRHTADSLAEHALPQLRDCAAEMAAELARPGGEARAAALSPMLDDTYLRAVKDELGPDFLQSLARGLAVLSTLRSPGGLTLTDVAEATGLARATARRCLLALRHLGYVRVSADGRRFTPLPRVLELGYAPQSRLTFDELAAPHLAALVQRVHDSASVAVLDGAEIRYVARVAATRVMGVDLAIGTRLPAYATSMGRAALSGHSDEELAARIPRALTPLTSYTRTSRAAVGKAVRAVRRDGYALVDQELEEGLRSIAVPVRDRDGRIVAAVNVAAHAAHRSADELRTDVLPELAVTAGRIETDLAAAIERHPAILG